ncbi:MAG TPA: putative nucleotidyltransferase substrate binding domain-containing protein [Thermoleophilaceae bacterium]|jgi:CBS domain-containing protein|nr:putative nucleotidyltransferase substrate binding domain-containing protein [Thermoleophilaceae bacterium]
MHDIAEFLSRHPPFDTLDEETLTSVAQSAEIEFHAAREPVLESAGAMSEFAYVVRRGSVELLIDGRLLDLLGEGEMFGFASLLDHGPLGFVARAAEDTLVYRFPGPAIRPVLERPAAARFIARSMNKGVRLLAGQDAGTQVTGLDRPVGELVRAKALVCTPDTGVKDAASRMVEARVTCVAVDLGDTLGIVTDRDIRERVVAAGAPPETPLSAVMSAPAFTVHADRSGAEALLEMLDHGIRHLPVLDAGRRLVGVLDDVDLLASEHRTPFRLRAQIARAGDPAAVAGAAAELPAVVIALHEADLPALAICRTISGIHDATTRRLLALAHQDLGAPPVPYTWLAMGSFGRREAFPSSDVDCAVAWQGPDDDRELSGRIREVAGRVLEGLAQSGFPPDGHGAVASSPLFARSVSAWEEAARAWVEEPDRDRGLMLLSVMVESDPVWGQTTVAERLFGAFARSGKRRLMLSRLLAGALASRPPTGFLRDFVLHSSGERKGVLDIKHGGLLPIESLARWGGLAAGVTAASTPARLDAARKAGTLTDEDAAVLRDAFELVCELRMEHQVSRLRDGEPPDDLIDPKRLAPLTRTALKEAFRGVRRVQRGLDAQRTLAHY